MSTELILAIPEISLLALACLVLVVDAYSNDPEHRLSYWLAQVGLLIIFVLVVVLSPDSPQIAFYNGFISDSMSAVLKAFICGITFIVFLYSYEYLHENKLIKGEYFVLGLFAVLGMMIMASAYSLLSVYLGLELLSLSMYAMVAMNRESSAASEAAVKYFVLGSLASGILLYGISMIYGLTGTIQLSMLTATVDVGTVNSSFLVFGMIFMIVGIAFKLGAAPFHMWMPDVYQGAPTSVALFIGTAPKLAAFAIVMRILVDGLLPLVESWQAILTILAILSMAVGNIIAISQSNIKRMLAYSTIAHVGYLFLGLIAGTKAGFAGSMFYIISYALMSMGAFGMIILLSRYQFEAENIDDYKGLFERSPWFAFIMMCLMFSLVGVPPFLGFWSKWFVLKELVASGATALATVAVVFSIIGAYYYLRIVKLMYFDKPETMTVINASIQMRMVLTTNGLIILILGLLPNWLIQVCLSALAG